LVTAAALRCFCEEVVEEEEKRRRGSTRSSGWGRRWTSRGARGGGMDKSVCRGRGEMEKGVVVVVEASAATTAVVVG
jgi:hypothetical protein